MIVSATVAATANTLEWILAPGTPSRGLSLLCGTISVNQPGEKFTPIDTYMLHKLSLDWLQSGLSMKKDEKTVVITHHIPSPSGIHPKYAGGELNHAFHSDLDDFIITNKPSLWIHGHTHDSMEYVIGETKIICNPRGYYPNDLNEKFKDDLIIEI